MMDNNNINYFEESEKYRPKNIKTLLIAEASPPSGKRYFYVPKAMSNKTAIEADTSLPATIFYHYFQRRPETVQEYVNLLNRLKDMGIFFMDIVDEPIKIRDKEGINQKNLAYLINKIQQLRRRIRARGITISEENITFLLARKNYKKQLHEEFPHSRLIRWIDFRLSSEEA
jgi:hypothetical protein